MLKTAITAVGVCAGAASAGTLLSSFSYENLHSSFDSGSGVLSATATMDSTGSVTRLAPSSATASFGEGSAVFSLDLSVSNITVDTADGAGTVTAVDLNGDTLTADVSGEFTYLPVVGPIGIIFFDGLMTNVFFNDVSGDGEFNGDAGSFFSTDFSGVAAQPFLGGIQRLQVGNTGFFGNDWDTHLAEVDGQIVPTPGSIALLGASALFATRRRRA